MQKRGFRVGYLIPANLIVSMSHEKYIEFFVRQSESCMMEWQCVIKSFYFQFLYLSKMICLIDNFKFFVLKIFSMASTGVEIRSRCKSVRLMLEIERKCKTLRCSDSVKTV